MATSGSVCTSRRSIWISSCLPMKRLAESSPSRYTTDGLSRQLENAGFEPTAQWIDRQDAFALSLAGAVLAKLIDVKRNIVSVERDGFRPVGVEVL